MSIFRRTSKFCNGISFSITIFILFSFIPAICQNLLDRFKLNDKNSYQIDLPNELKEISGIALSADGRLFGHNDEKGIIYQIDLHDGKILKKFYLGKNPVKKDFEDIAIIGANFYLITSSGELYVFSEGRDKQFVTYSIIETGLTKDNNVEGLCYDPETNCLLLACKGYPGEGYKKFKAVYAFSLNENRLLSKPRFLLPLNKMKDFSEENKFEPSGITRHAETGHFFVIAASGNTIVEISKTGEILAMKHLKEKMHSQPEGIVFKSVGELLISDEGQGGKATVTRYFTHGK